MIAKIAEDPRYGRDKGILLEATGLIRDRLIDPEPMTIEEAAHFLRVDESWVRKQVEKKHIPFHQTVDGGRIMFDRAELTAWWAAIRRDPVRKELRR